MNNKIIYNVAILGLSEIFKRHLSAINLYNHNFKIIGIYAPRIELVNKYSNELKCRAYANEYEIYNDANVNCVIILTPNHLHFTQTMQAISAGKHVILEKPPAFTVEEINLISTNATKQNVNVFVVLQYRLNPAVLITKKIIESSMLGSLTGVSLVQRWQRPHNYFNGWRGNMKTSGGILREFGIHYLDIMQFLVGLPHVKYASFYKNKFKHTDVADTIYALFDFEEFGGNAEITIACEPTNLTSSFIVRGSNGFIELGGKSLDEITALKLLNMDELQSKIEQIKDNVENNMNDSMTMVTTITTPSLTMPPTPYISPNYIKFYEQIICNPEQFSINTTYNVIRLIQDIYEFE